MELLRSNCFHTHSSPGCAPRPWACGWNRFAVRTSQDQSRGGLPGILGVNVPTAARSSCALARGHPHRDAIMAVFILGIVAVFAFELSITGVCLGSAFGFILPLKERHHSAYVAGSVAVVCGLLGGVIGLYLGFAGLGGNAGHGFTWYGFNLEDLIWIGALPALGSAAFAGIAMSGRFFPPRDLSTKTRSGNDEEPQREGAKYCAPDSHGRGP